MWLGSIRPRSQCVGGMLPVQWCYKHVLELSHAHLELKYNRLALVHHNLKRRARHNTEQELTFPLLHEVIHARAG